LVASLAETTAAVPSTTAAPTPAVHVEGLLPVQVRLTLFVLPNAESVEFKSVGSANPFDHVPGIESADVLVPTQDAPPPVGVVVTTRSPVGIVIDPVDGGPYWSPNDAPETVIVAVAVLAVHEKDGWIEKSTETGPAGLWFDAGTVPMPPASEHVKSHPCRFVTAVMLNVPVLASVASSPAGYTVVDESASALLGSASAATSAPPSAIRRAELDFMLPPVD